MVHQESDREDLLRQAKALVERVELTFPGCTKPLVIGFRKGGSASFFFGADPVYQFNAAGELRRAYLGGLLYKAERGSLWKTRRERCGDEVALLSTPLSDAETGHVLADLQARLNRLADALNSGRFALLGEIPVGSDVVSRIQAWLATLPATIRIASRPHVG